MTLINVEDQVRIHVQDLGRGPAVVFVSGFGLDHELWDRQVRVLTAAGYRTVCVTQRGHSHSDHPLHGYGIDRLSADLICVLETLGVTDATLVGHSFGGQVSFHTAANAPHLVSRLALIGSNAVRASRSAEFPFGAPPDDIVAQMVAAEENDRIASRHRLIETNFGAPPDPRIVDWLMRIWMRMPSWSAVACYNTYLRTDLVHEIDKVGQPVLQVNGTADRVHSRKGSAWLHARLSNARMVDMDCGHFPMLEAPGEFDAILLDFLGT